MLKFVIGMGIAAFVAMSPPSQAGQPTYLPLNTQITQEKAKNGVASWYGEECQGNPTASGESYNMDALTAAHPSLPLGTKIKVTNLRNHRSLVLRINDRGPYIPGRFLDVSQAAARRLGFMRSGKARVRIEVLHTAKDCGGHLVCPGARLFALN